MTPELRPVWWVARADSFSRTVTSSPRRASARAVASPTIPPPTTTTLTDGPSDPPRGQLRPLWGTSERPKLASRREKRRRAGSAVRAEPQQQLGDEHRRGRPGHQLAEQHGPEQPRPGTDRAEPLHADRAGTERREHGEAGGRG